MPSPPHPPSILRRIGQLGFVVVMMCLNLITQAQPPDTMWTRQFGEDDEPSGVLDVVSLSGGRTAVVGGVDGEDCGSGCHGYVRMVDSLGVQVWYRTYDYGTYGLSRFNAARADHDGNLVVGGGFYGVNGGIGLARLNSVGDTIWIRSIGTNGGEIEDLLISETGDIMAVGMRQSEITHRSEPFAVRYTSEGNLVFLRDYFVGVPATTPPYRRILAWSNGEMLITINSADSLTGASRNRMLRISALGDSLETIEFTGLPELVEFHVGATIPGTAIYLAGTRHAPGRNESIIASIHPSGVVLWQREIETYWWSEMVRDITISPLGGFFVTLEADVHVGPGPFDWRYAAYLARLTPNGDTLWTTTLGVVGDDLLSGKIDTTSGGGVVLGATVGIIVSHQFLARFDADTTIVDAVVPPRFYPRDFSLSTYPNPFNSTLTISLDVPLHQEISLSLFDILGREAAVIHRGRLNSTTLNYTTPATLSSGIYFLRAATNTNSTMQKVVLLK